MQHIICCANNGCCTIRALRALYIMACGHYSVRRKQSLLRKFTLIFNSFGGEASLSCCAKLLSDEVKQLLLVREFTTIISAAESYFWVQMKVISGCEKRAHTPKGMASFCIDFNNRALPPTICIFDAKCGLLQGRLSASRRVLFICHLELLCCADSCFYCAGEFFSGAQKLLSAADKYFILEKN